jgi:hypothetical protein
MVGTMLANGNNNILTAKIYQIRHIFDVSVEISGIKSFESLPDEGSKTFREIVGEMSTHHTLI